MKYRRYRLRGAPWHGGLNIAIASWLCIGTNAVAATRPADIEVQRPVKPTRSGSTTSPAPGTQPAESITPAARQAIERGLAYLARLQQPDGSYRAEKGANTGVVSFASLAFMTTGHVPDRGRYGRYPARGVDLVLRYSAPNGLICNLGDTTKGIMYEHAASLLLLAEASGVYPRPGLRDALHRGVGLTVACQNAEGAWRFEPQPLEGDLSVTIMQLVALQAAHEAGVRVPERVMDTGLRYVKRCATPGGGFLYQPGVGEVAYPRTAGSIRVLLGLGERDAPEVERGLRFLLEKRHAADRGEFHDFYGLYYAAHAVHLASDPQLARTWYATIREELLQRQHPDGHWDGEAGPIYGTAMAVLVLGAPDAYLPVEQEGGE